MRTTSDYYAGDGWVHVDITATTTSGAVQTYTGQYQVGGVIVSGSLTQTN